MLLDCKEKIPISAMEENGSKRMRGRTRGRARGRTRGRIRGKTKKQVKVSECLDYPECFVQY